MTLGNYPDSIPNKFFININERKQNLNLDRFSDISSKVGITDINLSGGSIIEDLIMMGTLILLLQHGTPMNH